MSMVSQIARERHTARRVQDCDSCRRAREGLPWTMIPMLLKLLLLLLLFQMVIVMIEDGHHPPPAVQGDPCAMCNYVMYGEIVYLKTPQRYILQRDQPQQHFRTVFHGFAFYCPELCLNLADKWTAINSLVQCRCIAWPFILIAICCGRSIDGWIRDHQRKSGWVAGSECWLGF